MPDTKKATRVRQSQPKMVVLFLGDVDITSKCEQHGYIAEGHKNTHRVAASGSVAALVAAVRLPFMKPKDATQESDQARSLPLRFVVMMVMRPNGLENVCVTCFRIKSRRRNRSPGPFDRQRSPSWRTVKDFDSLPSLRS